MVDKERFYKSELEYVTGKIYSGDMTVMVYYLLKDTQDMDSLMEYLTGERPGSNSEIIEEKIQKSPSFQDWFRGCTEIK